MQVICQQLPWGTLSERYLQNLNSNVMKATLDVFSLTCWLQTPFECRSAESPVADPTLFLALVWLSIITEFVIYMKSKFEFRVVLCTELWFEFTFFLADYLQCLCSEVVLVPVLWPTAWELIWYMIQHIYLTLYASWLRSCHLDTRLG